MFAQQTVDHTPNKDINTTTPHKLCMVHQIMHMVWVLSRGVFCADSIGCFMFRCTGEQFFNGTSKDSNCTLALHVSLPFQFQNVIGIGFVMDSQITKSANCLKFKPTRG